MLRLDLTLKSFFGRNAFNNKTKKTFLKAASAKINFFATYPKVGFDFSFFSLRTELFSFHLLKRERAREKIYTLTTPVLRGSRHSDPPGAPRVLPHPEGCGARHPSGAGGVTKREFWVLHTQQLYTTQNVLGKRRGIASRTPLFLKKKQKKCVLQKTRKCTNLHTCAQKVHFFAHPKNLLFLHFCTFSSKSTKISSSS